MNDHNINSTKSNFGRWGWTMIVYAGLMYFFGSGFRSDGLNVIVGNFAAAHALDGNQLLALATPASWAGFIGSIFWAFLVDKKGLRPIALITGLLGGLSFFLYGVASSTMGFFAVTAFVNFMCYGFNYTVATTLMSNWFPMKKGLALGWATMGQNMASAAFVPLFLFIMHRASMTGSFYTMGILLAVVSVIGFFILRDHPEERGCAPDNGSFTKEEIEANLKELQDYKSPWTPAKLLKNKQVWLIGLSLGIYVLVTVSLISQMIPRLMSCGWSETKSTGMMTIAAFFGLLGSYATGWLDQKVGTKKACILYGIWYLVGLIFCIVPASSFTLYASVFFIGIGIGGVGNLFPSMVGTVFGRFDFVRALGVITPIHTIVNSFAFAVVAFGLAYLGGYSGAYAIVAVLDVIAIILVALVDDTCIGKN